MIIKNYLDAPKILHAIEGNCGLISAWMVLRYFHKRASATDIIKTCAYTKNRGVFSIGIAVCLAKYGLSVSFYSQPDNHKKPLEKRLYTKAHQLGVHINRAITLQQILHKLDKNHIPIIFYETTEHIGHFSPLVGTKRRSLVLPNTVSGKITIKDFERGWNRPGICQQCLIAEAA